MSLHLLGIQDKKFDPGEVKPIYLHESNIYIALSISDREAKEVQRTLEKLPYIRNETNIDASVMHAAIMMGGGANLKQGVFRLTPLLTQILFFSFTFKLFSYFPSSFPLPFLSLITI